MKNRLAPYQSTETFTPVGNNAYIINPKADNMYQLAELQSFKNTLKAALAKQCLDNTAVLARAEEFYIRAAPAGKADYRRIVESYVAYSIAELVGGDW